LEAEIVCTFASVQATTSLPVQPVPMAEVSASAARVTIGIERTGRGIAGEPLSKNKAHRNTA